MIALTSSLGTIGYNVISRVVVHDAPVHVEEPLRNIVQEQIFVANLKEQIAVVFNSYAVAANRLYFASLEAIVTPIVKT